MDERSSIDQKGWGQRCRLLLAMGSRNAAVNPKECLRPCCCRFHSHVLHPPGQLAGAPLTLLSLTCITPDTAPPLYSRSSTILLLHSVHGTTKKQRRYRFRSITATPVSHSSTQLAATTAPRTSNWDRQQQLLLEQHFRLSIRLSGKLSPVEKILCLSALIMSSINTKSLLPIAETAASPCGFAPTVI